MIQHQGPISGVSTFESKYVASAGYDNQVILWDATTHSAIARGFHDHLANSCAFSSDGKYLVSAGSDQTARLWRLPEMKLISVLSNHADDVEMAVFHPTRNLIATACRDHLVRVFDFSGALVHLFAGHEADVISVAWVGNRDDLISSSDDGTIRRWSCVNQQACEIIDLKGVETDTLVVLENDCYIAGNDAGEIILIQKNNPQVFQAHQAGIKRLAFFKELKLLLSVSYDRTLKLWVISPTGDIILKNQAKLPALVWPRSCAFLGLQSIIFGTFGSKYAIYNWENDSWELNGIESTLGINAVTSFADEIYTVGDAGKVLKKENSVQNSSDYQLVAEMGSLCNFLLPAGLRLLTGGQMGIVFDAITGEALYQHRSPLNCAAILPTCKTDSSACLRVIIGTYTGEGIVLKIGANGQIGFEKSILLHDNAVKGIAVSGSTFFSVCATGEACFYQFEADAEIKLLSKIPTAHSKIANGCAAADTSQFYSVSRDLILRQWSAGKLTNQWKSPHTYSIKCVAVSADSKWVATGSYGGYLAIFDVTRQEWLSSARLSASGISALWATSNEFLMSCYDGTQTSIKYSTLSHREIL